MQAGVGRMCVTCVACALKLSSFGWEIVSFTAVNREDFKLRIVVSVWLRVLYHARIVVVRGSNCGVKASVTRLYALLMRCSIVENRCIIVLIGIFLRMRKCRSCLGQ